MCTHPYDELSSRFYVEFLEINAQIRIDRVQYIHFWRQKQRSLFNCVSRNMAATRGSSRFEIYASVP